MAFGTKNNQTQVYKYIANNSSGEVVRGELKAINEDSALRQLDRLGLEPVSVNPFKESLWNRDISSHAGFSVDEDYLYITDDKSNIWAYDRFNGGSAWKQDILLNRQLTAPAVIGNYLVVGDFEGYLHWMDKVTGALVARQRISKNRIIVAPVISGDTVYAFSTNGQLAALSYK